MIFIQIKESKSKMVKCKVCGSDIKQTYMPMEEWKMEGPMCGKCYSQKISEQYPGDHVRVDTSTKDQS